MSLWISSHDADRDLQEHRRSDSIRLGQLGCCGVQRMAENSTDSSSENSLRRNHLNPGLSAKRTTFLAWGPPLARPWLDLSADGI